MTVSSHEDLLGFLPNLAASILAGWGIVKLVATFLITYSGEVVLDEDTEDAKDIETGGQTANVVPVEDGK